MGSGDSGPRFELPARISARVMLVLTGFFPAKGTPVTPNLATTPMPFGGGGGGGGGGGAGAVVAGLGLGSQPLAGGGAGEVVAEILIF